MDRFGQLSLQKIDVEITNTVPKNTKRTHHSIWQQFLEFCKERSYQLDNKTNLKELAKILKDWGYNMRKKNGEEYKEGVIKTMWNIVAKKIQEKYHNEYGITFDPFRDITFKAARDARNAKRRTLQQIPSKRKESSTALSTEEHTKIIHLWDENTPEGLQRKLYHIIAVELAWRGGEASNCLTSYFKEELDHEGNHTGRVEYNPITSKTAQGGDKKLTDSKWLIQNPDENVCPVRLLKKLLSRRGDHIKNERLFLTPNPYWNNSGSIGWYKNCPLGKNEVSKWTKHAAEKIGIKNAKITNHSNRSTAVSKLAKSGTEEQQLIKITGHSSASSLKPYLQMDPQHHFEIINKMRDMPNNTSSCSSSKTSSTVNSNDNQTNNYYNCNFYTNCNNTK